MNQDQSQTGPVPQTAADLHAAVRGMPLPYGMWFINEHFNWRGGMPIHSDLAALALEGWYSRMLDDTVNLSGFPWWKCEPSGCGRWRVSWVPDDESIADGPTKLHAMVAALRALGVGSDPGATA